MSTKAWREYLRALYSQYQRGTIEEKGHMLGIARRAGTRRQPSVSPALRCISWTAWD